MFLSKVLKLVFYSQKVFSALCNLDNVLQSAGEKKETLAGPVLPEVPKNHICVDSPLCIPSLHILEKELYWSWAG